MPNATLAQNLPASANKRVPITDILAYRAKGLSQSEIAKLVGTSQQNITQRLAAANIQSLENFREQKDNGLEYKQAKIVNALSSADIEKMSGLQKIIGIKVLEETIRMIRGQAGVTVEVRVIDETMREAFERLSKAGLGVQLGVSQQQDVIEVEEDR